VDTLGALGQRSGKFGLTAFHKTKEADFRPIANVERHGVSVYVFRGLVYKHFSLLSISWVIDPLSIKNGKVSRFYGVLRAYWTAPSEFRLFVLVRLLVE
jgi:hypothetical protein